MDIDYNALAKEICEKAIIDLVDPDTPGAGLTAKMIEISTTVAMRCIKRYHEERMQCFPQSDK